MNASKITLGKRSSVSSVSYKSGKTNYISQSHFGFNTLSGSLKSVKLSLEVEGYTPLKIK
jgi:hypothetical protein